MTNRAKLGVSAIAAAAAIGLPLAIGWSRSAQAAASVPPAALVEPAKGHREVAVLAGGCFWGVEGVYEHVKGVSDVTSGFAGSKAAGASYEKVSSGATGNAEAVRIVFDPTRVSYAELLRIFFAVAHDPTEVNRQGPDVGTQYRSAIFPQDETQREGAVAAIARANEANDGKVVTTIEPKAEWYPAEDYHQDYWAGEGQNNAYCVAVIPPKLAKLRKSFQARVKSEAAA